MKSLSEWTEAELMQANEARLGRLLAEHIFEVKPHNTVYGRWRVFLLNKIYFTDDLASTGNGMLEVLEAMKEKYNFNQYWDGKGKWHVELYSANIRDRCCVHHTSLPRAVAVAALLAVKEKCSR